ncbi:MAG: hypothetical protein M1839_001971 [Geoglossum umbratile]|nr:MAG: hypothetical protein M1839_001971 [Geoglossum umbratile]
MSGSVALKAKGTFHPFSEPDKAPQPNESKDAGPGQKSSLKKSLTGLGSKSATPKKEETSKDGDKPARDDGEERESSLALKPMPIGSTHVLHDSDLSDYTWVKEPFESISRPNAELLSVDRTSTLLSRPNKRKRRQSALTIASLQAFSLMPENACRNTLISAFQPGLPPIKLPTKSAPSQDIPRTYPVKEPLQENSELFEQHFGLRTFRTVEFDASETMLQSY